MAVAIWDRNIAEHAESHATVAANVREETGNYTRRGVIRCRPN